jgi:hypothetical protein
VETITREEKVKTGLSATGLRATGLRATGSPYTSSDDELTEKRSFGQKIKGAIRGMKEKITGHHTTIVEPITTMSGAPLTENYT